MKNLFIILSLIFSMSAQAKLASLCTRALQAERANDLTTNFIAYLHVLFKEGYLKIEHFEKMASHPHLTNPYYNQIDIPSEAIEHRNSIQEYINHAEQLDQRKILSWIKNFLNEITEVQEQKQSSQEHTQIAYTPMKFHRIEPGNFLRDPLKSGKPTTQPTVPAELNQAFEMLHTKVTIKMWMDLVGTIHPQGFDQNPLNPELPVTRVSWWSAVAYANLLSIKNNLPPVYNFENVDFNPDTSLEKGNLMPKDEVAALKALKINAPNEDIYLAKGYRLPTQAEQEFVLTNRGQGANGYFTGLNKDNLKYYAHYNEDGMTPAHPAAQLQALLINGNEFYDLYGNASEWSHDLIDDGPTKGGLNPLGMNFSDAESYNKHAFKGGGRTSRAVDLLAGNTSRYDLNPRAPGTISIGFRLVRSLPEKKP